MHKRKIAFKHGVWASLLLCGAPNVNASDTNEANFLAMSLEQLMQIQVSVATKSPQTQNSAPAIISVISRDELRLYGGRNLADVLQRAPSLLVFGSSFMDNTAASMRGGKLTHTDDWILLLINGRPLRESHNGGLSSDIYSQLPLEFIERIEIMRGPGSSLYGTNAFTGVINIVTRQFEADSNSEMTLTAGSFNTRRANFSTGSRGSNYHWALDASVLDSGGWQYAATDEAGNYDSRARDMSGAQMALQASYEDFHLNTIIGNFNQFTAGLFLWNLASDDNIPQAQVQRRFIDLGYHPQLSTDWRLEINHSYSGHTLEDRSARRQSGGGITEIASFYTASDQLQLLSGVVMDILHGDLNTHADGGRYTIERYRSYLQADYQLTPALKSVTGIQWNHSQNTGSNFSPRLGLVGTINEDWSYKILYGEAYRNAYAFQQFFKVPGFEGNPALKPELIDTYDLQVNYQRAKTSLSAGYFYSTIKQAHNRISNDGIATIINSDQDIISQGIELEFKNELSRQIRLEGSLLYQKSKNSDDKGDALFNPELMAKVGLVYQNNASNISLGIFENYFTAAGKTETQQNNINVVNPPADAYHLLTLNLNWQVPHIDSLQASLFCDNLLNEDIYYPDLNRRAVNTLPQHSGRAFYLNLNYAF